MAKIKVAILISGRGSNMKVLIDACKNQDFPAEIALVISNKKDAKGLEIAASSGIATEFIDHKKFASRQEFDAAMSEKIEEYGCKIVCLAGFMRLLSEQFVQKWYDRSMNIHPSLLPDFKGADAVGDAIKAGAKVSGCTVHLLRSEMDTGPILEQASVEVLQNDTKESLAARILQKEHEIYPKALKKLCEMIIL
jgi:phosphoribosylglycinamide formyltransferase 1